MKKDDPFADMRLEGRKIAQMLARMREKEDLRPEFVAWKAGLTLEDYQLFENQQLGLRAAQVYTIENVIYQHTQSRLRCVKSRREYLKIWLKQVPLHLKFRWFQFWVSVSEAAFAVKFLLVINFFLITLLSTIISLPPVGDFYRGLGRLARFFATWHHLLLPPLGLMLVIIFRRIDEKNKE